MIDFQNCTEEELWRYVASHLKSNGIDTILVGGAVVSIYSEGIYKSGDLDLVLGSLFTKGLETAMNQIGFKKHGRHYVHPDCKHLFVEFPGSPPLGIGSDYSIEPVEVINQQVKIKILSPTDCVKDRLASFIFFSDRDGLDQALLVAKNKSVDMQSIEAWCKKEGYPDAFKEFKDLLN
jgi:hypothetical protein